MPAAKVFADTTMLVYLQDRSSQTKRDTVQHWLLYLSERKLLSTNLQVLNELTNVLLRKRWFDSPALVFSIVDTFAALGSTPLTGREQTLARELHLATKYAWWDCLLLASAVELGCTHFLSEDLQDGQAIAGLTIVDPFAHTPEQILR